MLVEIPHMRGACGLGEWACMWTLGSKVLLTHMSNACFIQRLDALHTYKCAHTFTDKLVMSIAFHWDLAALYRGKVKV